jgi:hypothetical protein
MWAWSTTRTCHLSRLKLYYFHKLSSKLINMLVTYRAVKLMEILNRKRIFPDLTEISALGHSFFSQCFDHLSSLFFFSVVSFFSLFSIILYVFLPRVTVFSKKSSWKLIQFTLEANMSITRSDSGVSRIRRQLQYLVPYTPQLQIRPCFRKEFWNKRPYINDAIFIFHTKFPLKFPVERRYLFPAVELFFEYTTLMRKMWIKFYFETLGRAYDYRWSSYIVSTSMTYIRRCYF